MKGEGSTAARVWGHVMILNTCESDSIAYYKQPFAALSIEPLCNFTHCCDMIMQIRHQEQHQSHSLNRSQRTLRDLGDWLHVLESVPPHCRSPLWSKLGTTYYFLNLIILDVLNIIRNTLLRRFLTRAMSSIQISQIKSNKEVPIAVGIDLACALHWQEQTWITFIGYQPLLRYIAKSYYVEDNY